MHNEVNVFINLADRIDENNIDTLFLPNKNILLIKIDMKHFKLNELLLWYTLMDDGLIKLLDPEVDERTFME